MKKFIFLSLLLTLTTNAKQTKIEDVDYSSLTKEQRKIFNEILVIKNASMGHQLLLKDIGSTESRRNSNNFYNCVVDGVQASSWAALEGYPIVGLLSKTLGKTAVKSFNSHATLTSSKSFDMLFDTILANEEDTGEYISDELIISGLGVFSYIADIAVYAYDVAKGNKSIATDPIDYHYFRYTFGDTRESAKDLMEGSEHGLSNSCADRRKQVLNINREIKTLEQKQRQLEISFYSAESLSQRNNKATATAK